MTSAISGYHAHVYFDAATRERAWALRELVGKTFADTVAANAVTIGRFHERPVGPHPRWSFQIAFAPAEFERVVPWLMLNRGGLTVFLHPETGDALGDHAERAVWMGELLSLNLDVLR